MRYTDWRVRGTWKKNRVGERDAVGGGETEKTGCTTDVEAIFGVPFIVNNIAVEGTTRPIESATTII